MLHQDVSTLQGPELHLEVSGQQQLLLLQDYTVHYRGLNCTDRTVSRLKEPVLLLEVSTLKRSVLHLDVSAPQVA
jgi:hypothetical protein